MQDVAANVPDLEGKALLRFENGLARLKPPVSYDLEQAQALLARLQG